MSTRAQVPPDPASAPWAWLLGAGDGAESAGITAAIAAEGMAAIVAADTNEALGAAPAIEPALAVVLLRPGQASGLSALESLRRRWPRLPVLLVAERPTVAEAVAAMQAGAAWYGGEG